MKNLVLPALGKFTIVCDQKVVERDFSNEFLVTREDLGKDKSEVIKNMLLELNPDVKGYHVVMSIQDYIDKHADQLAKATIVIASDVSQT